MSVLPIAAAESTAEILTTLFVVLLAAKLFEELFRRLHQPAVVGMIIAGVVLGPSATGLVETSDVLDSLADLGVVFLLFWVGLETRISSLRSVGPTALKIGVLGFIFPLIAGVAIGFALGETTITSIFIGAALVATSVGITSAVLIELDLVDTVAARAVLGAAIIDDILALLLLGIAEGAAGGGGVDPAEIAVIAVMTTAFLAFFAFFGTRFARERPHLLEVPRVPNSPLIIAVLVCLGLAALAAQIGLAAIIGAFLAGMILAETSDQHPLEKKIEPLYEFFPPFFFVVVGLQVDLAALAEVGTLGILALITVAAIIAKYAGALLGAGALARPDARFAAVGMVPRGEVGIIVAEIGLVAGALDEQLFAVIVAMSVLTTVVVPPVLRHISAELTPG